MFQLQANGGLVIDENYRQEIADSKTDRKIRVDFTADGFINSAGDYYAKFDVSGAFDFGGNQYLIYSNSTTTTTGYNGRNIHTTGTAFFTIPHGIQRDDLLFLLIKVIRAATGDISQPYHLTFTEMGNTGQKGDKGDKGDPVPLPRREVLFNETQIINNNATGNYTTRPDKRLQEYKNLQLSIYITTQFEETNIVILD